MYGRNFVARCSLLVARKQEKKSVKFKMKFKKRKQLLNFELWFFAFIF